MVTINVYLLSAKDEAAINDCNCQLQKNRVVMCICDHGRGPCIDADDLELAPFTAWRNALNAITPISERTIVKIVLPDDV